MLEWFAQPDLDFWPFLTSGGVLLAAVDRVFCLGWQGRENCAVVQVGLAAVLAYATWHMIAEAASRRIEGALLHRLPPVHLVRHSKPACRADRLRPSVTSVPMAHQQSLRRGR